MRHFVISVCLAFLTVVPAQAVEFLGVNLCKGSVDTSVVLPVGSPLSLESSEIGRHGGLLMLLKADNGDVMDHLDNLMAFYTDARGTGDSKKLQWAGNEITAYASLIKKGFAALAVSTDDDCLAAEGAAAARVTDDTSQPEAAGESTPESAAPPVSEESPVTIALPESVAAATVASSKSSPVPDPAPLPVEDFALKGNIKHSSTEESWVDVMGVVVNNTASDYHIANFDLSFYDKNGNLICVDGISVSELRTGQERAFRDSIRCADYAASAVASWKLQFSGGQ